QTPYSDGKNGKHERNNPGDSLPIAHISKGVMVALVLWSLLFLLNANGLPTTFIIFRSFVFAISTYATAFIACVISFFSRSFEAYAARVQGRLFGWQAGWTTFYWVWWIAFCPAPSCFAWIAMLGGTAADLEVAGTTSMLSYTRRPLNKPRPINKRTPPNSGRRVTI
ncbi:BCCT family transporter, partial [Ruegeria arenilitoris]|uniref:BCCT family transporter n=1 Tax=Ruegeria arenilitoris TaxID=1173585 RepID=UPI00147A088E